MTTLSDLNENCLQAIFKSCPLESQFALAKTCKLFETLVQDIWKSIWSKLELELSDDFNKICMEDNEINISNEDLQILLKLIHPYIQVLIAKGKTVYDFEVLKRYNFPKTEKLHLSAERSRSSFRFLFDKRLFRFPNLRTLKVYDIEHSDSSYMEFLGVRYPQTDNMWLWYIIYTSKLRSLTLDTYHSKVRPHFKDYSFLSELEELTLPVNETKPILNGLKIMDKLKKLNVTKICDNYFNDFYCLNKELSTLPRLRAVKITAYLGYSFYTCLFNILKNLQCLKKLTITVSYMPKDSEFAKDIPMLKELIIYKGEISYINLDAFLKTENQVEILHLYKCRMEPITLNIAEIAKYRTKPITINIVKGKRPRHDIKLSAPTELVKITEIPCKQPVRDAIIYRFIFYPI